MNVGDVDMMDDPRVEARLDRMPYKEFCALVGNLAERCTLDDDEYRAKFPNSPFCFPSVEAWLEWMDMAKGMSKPS